MEHAEKSGPSYMLVFVGLALLTLIEVGVAGLAWSETVIILLLVGLAIWKAALVALYYMHLRFEPPRLVIMVLAPLPLALILVLAVLTEF